MKKNTVGTGTWSCLHRAAARCLWLCACLSSLKVFFPLFIFDDSGLPVWPIFTMWETMIWPQYSTNYNYNNTLSLCRNAATAFSTTHLQLQGVTKFNHLQKYQSSWPLCFLSFLFCPIVILHTVACLAWCTRNLPYLLTKQHPHIPV